MAKLRDVAEKVRSKNAGPFWLTIDIFCPDSTSFEQVKKGLSTAQVARVFDVSEADLKRFEIVDLDVIKFSLPRPAIQGTRQDRDMHGAGFAELLAEIEMG